MIFTIHLGKKGASLKSKFMGKQGWNKKFRFRSFAKYSRNFIFAFRKTFLTNIYDKAEIFAKIKKMLFFHIIDNFVNTLRPIF
jgi:hypothetical protein